MGLVLSTWVIALAQPGSIDSVKLLQSASSDTSRVTILNQLSFKYLVSQPRLARQYADEALALSRTSNFKRGEIEALNRLGENEFRQSNYANAVDYTTQSLKLAEQLRDTFNMAKAYRVLGNIHTFGFRQYDLALQYQLLVLKIYEKTKDKRNIASTYGNITWIYASTNRNLQEAHRLADRGANLADSLGDKQLLSYNYNSKGLIFSQEGKSDSALRYLDLSILMARESNDRAVIAYDKSIKGNVYLRMGDFKKAIEMFQLASAESQQLNAREVLKQSYEGLTKSYAALGNYPLAFKNHLLFTALKDSLLNWETAQKAMITRLQFEEEKREAKIAELELANQYARNESIIYNALFGVVLLSLIAVIVLVVRNSKQRSEGNKLLKEKNEEIAEQNRKLKEANDVKDKFFSIIGHDLRSPLVSLKGLLGLLMRNEITELEFKSFAPKLHHLVIGTNETLENILQWASAQMNGWNHTPSLLVVHGHVSKCFSLFAEAAKAKEIALVNHVGEKETVYAETNQMELIIRNLVHNAIKFSSKGGSVQVTTVRIDELLELRVSDDGIGMSKELVESLFQKRAARTRRGTEGERGTGLGLILCKEMVENNGGKIFVSSEVGKGSTFHVLLKMEK